MTASVKPAKKFVTTERLAALRLQMMAGEMARQIGARIRQRREELHLNQGQLAARFESDAINNQRISDWERGVHKPSERYMERLAEILERDISWFYATAETNETPDLMGAFSDDDQAQLDRIEAKLDELLSRLPAERLDEVLAEAARQRDEQTKRTAAESRRKTPKRRAS